MRVSRIVVKNFRALREVDVPLGSTTTIVIGENNAGKTCLIHALRLCLDVGLSSSHRTLTKEDIHVDVDQNKPFQVLVGVEFSDFQGKENEEALLYGAQIAKDRARIFYRYRPKRRIRESLARQEIEGERVLLEDYNWEIAGGGDPAIDLAAIEWNHENADFGASMVGLQYWQSYLVVFLPAMRDVENDLQYSRRSSLARLIDVTDIDADEQANLIAAIRTTNEQIEASPAIKAIATTIDACFKEISGPAFSLDVELGLSSPSFQAIVRNLVVLLSSGTLKQFEPRRNGLGLNNILYIAMLIEQFRKRAKGGKAAGELILIEEPEAHLHPQLQNTLLDALKAMPFQAIVTTHSTQVTARASLPSLVALTSRRQAHPVASAPAVAANLTPEDIQDLERYLDATKSNLLFAQRVMLVEGAAELLLLPPLIKKVLNFDLEREGISLVAIHGTHFGPFARLFSDASLPKPCAIVADADLDPEVELAEDEVPEKEDLNELEGTYVKVFLGATTFERELTVERNLGMLASTAEELGAPRIGRELSMCDLLGDEVTDEIKDKVLRTARRFGKARFAQVAARHVSATNVVPPYIAEAIAWLRQR